MDSDNRRHIAIIIWRWNLLKDQIISKDLLVNYTQDDFESVFSKYVMPYQVVKRSATGEEPYQTPHQVVCVRTSPDHDQAIIPFLKDLADHYSKEQATSIFLFLHRNDNFNQESIDLVYDNSHVQKCFLFSDGQDFLYYDTQSIGLIDDDGDFYFNPPIQKKPEIAVADDDNQWVFHSYFEQTWAYYQNEYSSKLLELREDLLDYFMERVEDLDSPMSANNFNEILIADNYLNLRVKSFVEHPNLSSKESRTLRLLEQHSQKSYSFDDLQAFAKQNETTHQTYLAIKDSLYQIYRPDNDNALKTYAPRRLMNVIQGNFLKLTRQFSAHGHKLTSHEP